MVDRFRLRYREGDRSMLINQELQADPRLVAIERESMRAWEPPHEREALTEAAKDRIIDNMRLALATRGYGLTLLDAYFATSQPDQPAMTDGVDSTPSP